MVRFAILISATALDLFAIQIFTLRLFNVFRW